jgi:hypothetical protein
MPTNNSINSGLPQTLNDLTEDTAPSPSTDYLLEWDTSAALSRKVLMENVLAGELSVTDTGTLNDYSPTGLGNAYYLSWAGTGSTYISGMATGSTGRVIVLANNSVSRVLCLLTNSTLSVAANRFEFINFGRAAHIILFPGESIRLRYRGGLWTEEVPGSYRLDAAHTFPRILKAVPNTGTTMQSVGIATTSMGGTISTNAISASFRGQIPRTTGSTGATAGTSSGMRGTQNLCWRGNAAGLGGFHYRNIFFFGAPPTTASFFNGLIPTAAIGNVEANSLLNCIGICKQASDVNLNIVRNDGTGLGLVNTSGSDYPVDATAVYELHIFALPNAANIQLAMIRLDSLSVLPIIETLTADIPVNTALLTPVIWGNNRTTAADFNFSWADIELKIP